METAHAAMPAGLGGQNWWVAWLAPGHLMPAQEVQMLAAP